MAATSTSLFVYFNFGFFFRKHIFMLTVQNWLWKVFMIICIYFGCIVSLFAVYFRLIYANAAYWFHSKINKKKIGVMTFAFRTPVRSYSRHSFLLSFSCRWCFAIGIIYSDIKMCNIDSKHRSFFFCCEFMCEISICRKKNRFCYGINSKNLDCIFSIDSTAKINFHRPCASLCEGKLCAVPMPTHMQSRWVDKYRK